MRVIAMQHVVEDKDTDTDGEALAAGTTIPFYSIILEINQQRKVLILENLKIS